jgi:hypothetical protein
MVKVTYKGRLQLVTHRGVHAREYPYTFIQGAHVEITDPEDIAMFRAMAQSNPDTWEIGEGAVEKVEKAVERVARTVKGR